MGEERHMRHHLVVDEFITHRDLGGSIESDEAPKTVGVDDNQSLMRGRGIEENVRNPVFGGEAILLMQRLAIPERAVEVPREAVLAVHRSASILTRPHRADAP